MSTEIYFANNYRDLCEQHGTASGFQFEFYCWRCHDTWRSPFEPYRGGRLAGWLNRGIGTASGLLGRAWWGVTSAAEGLAGSGWGNARDAAFQRAIGAAQGHFNRCARCATYVCGRCWHQEQGLCFTCAPDSAGEMMAARQRGVNDMVTQQAYDEGQRQGKAQDGQTARQLVCPRCRAECHGGRFCPGCGYELAQQASCSSCRATLPDGVTFCPTCGQRQ
ncbi:MULTISPECIES: zinc ribbon domain-containing protein [Streptomyces]|uniref:Zinc ribbon domain-containing protein n=2 Tax=Streptomyces TaxID=1883 RepID=A0ABW7T5F3_9ACTN